MALDAKRCALLLKIAPFDPRIEALQLELSDALELLKEAKRHIAHDELVFGDTRRGAAILRKLTEAGL